MEMFSKTCLRAETMPRFQNDVNLACLFSKGQWVSDTVMAEYSSLLARTHDKQFVYIGSRFGFVEPLSLSRFHCVDFAKACVLFPVLDQAHWTLIRVCNAAEGTCALRVTLFDGLGMAPSAFDRIQHIIGQYFAECSSNPNFRRRSRTKWDPEQWRRMATQATFHKTVADIPKQCDGYTCGFRVLHYMEWLLLRPQAWASDSFEHDNDDLYWELYRQRVLYALCVDAETTSPLAET